MPLKTAIPIEARAEAPAPRASTSGSTPRIKAKEVITMGRKRLCAASTAASVMLCGCRLRCAQYRQQRERQRSLQKQTGSTHSAVAKQIHLVRNLTQTVTMRLTR